MGELLANGVMGSSPRKSNPEPLDQGGKLSRSTLCMIESDIPTPGESPRLGGRRRVLLRSSRLLTAALLASAHRRCYGPPPCGPLTPHRKPYAAARALHAVGMPGTWPRLRPALRFTPRRLRRRLRMRSWTTGLSRLLGKAWPETHPGPRHRAPPKTFRRPAELVQSVQGYARLEPLFLR
jgi:hypothetical protein